MTEKRMHRKSHQIECPGKGAAGSATNANGSFLSGLLGNFMPGKRSSLVRDLHRRINFDMLTGLPNRYSLQKKLSSLIASKDIGNFAFMFINIDSFRNVNGISGHIEGDQLLCRFADRLGSLDGWDLFAGRFSGDTFVVMYPGCPDSKKLMHEAKEILARLSGEYAIGGTKHDVTASIGVSRFPSDGSSPTELVRKADIALHQAKKLGNGRIVFFNDKIDKELRTNVRFERNLKKALLRDEFFLEYQPQYDFKTGRISGFESLLRWKNPECGIVSPGDFIPVAERTGGILTIGEFVMRKSFLFLRKLGELEDPYSVSVNVSAVQLSNPDFVPMVSSVISESPEHAHCLHIEITETVNIRSFDDVAEKIRTLKKMGVKISLDDFGTGYSSLSYLRRIPFDELKIDKSFICDIDSDEQTKRIMSPLIDLAHSFNLKVVAEGIENREQLDILRNCGCDKIQGYLIGKPASEEVSFRILSSTRIMHRT
jgi:diguanylate cyclase (GGDEF)-like protein